MPAASARSASKGRYNLCENYGKPGLHRQYGHNHQGADATYVVHGVKSIFRLPDAIGFEEGAVIDPASIALHCANRGGIQPGDNVVITGAGAIGLLGGDAARIRGAGRVIVVGRGRRLAKAAEMGFETVDTSAGEPVAAVRSMTDGLGADVVLEAAGVPETLDLGTRDAAAGRALRGRGHPDRGRGHRPASASCSTSWRSSGSRASAGEMRRVMPHVEQGRMRVREVMTHEFPLERFAEALATFRDRDSGAIKIIVKP